MIGATWTLNMMGTFLNATSSFGITLMVLWVVTRTGVAYKRYLWIVFAYTFVQSIAASMVSMNLYFQHFPIWTAIARVVLGMLHQAITLIIAYRIKKIVSSLRATHNEEVALQDDRHDKQMIGENVLFFAKRANKEADQHLNYLRRQNANLMSEKGV